MFRRLTTSLRRVSRTDQSLVRRSARLPHTRADEVLGVLSRSANRSGLWFAIAAVLACKRGRSRRAALRGVAAIAGASTSASLVAKRLFPRRRPAAELVPPHRRLGSRPTSSSFPSGHSASAVAFTTAVALEHPAVAVAIAPVAAAVAYSRVHTGVHWPSDVGAGAVIGVGAALATMHWWPRSPYLPALTTHRAEAPVMVDGEDLVAVVNKYSGDPGFDPSDQVSQAWPKATQIQPDGQNDLRDELGRVIETAGSTESPVRALAVAGGDGTVAAVAAVAADYELPLALIPAGTLNHFARDVGVRSMVESDEATERGAAVGVDLAKVDIVDHDGRHDDGRHDEEARTHTRWFVNTASLGGYPEMVALREKLEHRLSKWPAAALAMWRTLRRAEPFEVTLDDEPTMVWMFFVGNGTYLPKGFAPMYRPSMDTGLLDVRYLRADLPYSRARFVLATLSRTLEVSHVYRQRDVTAITVRLAGRAKPIAVDGEVGPKGTHFEFRSRQSALTIYRK